MTAVPSLLPHPRLFASAEQLDRLRLAPRNPPLKRCAETVAEDAEQYYASTELRYDRTAHNSLLLRAREMQRRIITLLVRWQQTGSERFRAAALRDVWTMDEWEYWSWDCERAGNPDPNAGFDLSYGENSATLALAYDWLFITLSKEEKRRFLDIAVRRSIRPFLAHTTKKNRLSWFARPDSNWNTVCAGGAGMLALAVYEDVGGAREVLRRVEQSIPPYMHTLEKTDGGWPEGIGYWGYGHRYAFWYLLSWERATQQSHPLLQLKGTNATLEFPLDFCPNGQPCSFGDVNVWWPMAFQYAAAERLGRMDQIPRLDALLDLHPPRQSGQWPNAAELLIAYPRGGKLHATAPRRLVAKRYLEMDWCVLADRLPSPSLYFSIRGGGAGANVPHSHLDLLSFQCVTGRERLIDNIGCDEYLDTTFSGRRYELYEMTPHSKNTILINGVGIANPAAVQTEALSGKGWKGFRLDATQAMGRSRGRAPAASACVRLFLLLEGPAAIVLDHVDLPHPGRVESRVHSFSSVTVDGSKATIQGKKETLQIAAAATLPFTFSRTECALTKPERAPSVLRCCSDGRSYLSSTMAMLMAPGKKAVSLDIRRQRGAFILQGSAGGARFRLRLSGDLRRIRPA